MFQHLYTYKCLSAGDPEGQLGDQADAGYLQSPRSPQSDIHFMPQAPEDDPLRRLSAASIEEQPSLMSLRRGIIIWAAKLSKCNVCYCK